MLGANDRLSKRPFVSAKGHSCRKLVPISQAPAAVVRSPSTQRHPTSAAGISNPTDEVVTTTRAKHDRSCRLEVATAIRARWRHNPIPQIFRTQPNDPRKPMCNLFHRLICFIVGHPVLWETCCGKRAVGNVLWETCCGERAVGLIAASDCQPPRASVRSSVRSSV
jgi:hypothetical protein